MKKVWIITRKHSWSENRETLAVVTGKKIAVRAVQRFSERDSTGDEWKQLLDDETRFVIECSDEHTTVELRAEQHDVATNATELKRILR